VFVTRDDTGEAVPIKANKKLNDEQPGTQFLFVDSRYKLQLDSLHEQSQEYIDLRDNFDGYTLYQRTGWLKLTDSTKKVTRGLFTEIPNRGYVGWVCSWTGDSQQSYGDGQYLCASQWVPMTDFLADYVPNFTQVAPTGT
jgi:hypothetical protein